MALKASGGPSCGGGDGSLWMSITQIPEGAAETPEINAHEAINHDSRGLKIEIMLYFQDA